MTLTKWQKRTLAYIIANVAVTVLYDFAAAYWGGKQATISVMVTWLSKSFIIVSLGVGILIGHFYAQNDYSNSIPKDGPK